MNLNGDGLLKPEPTRVDYIRGRTAANRAAVRRQRATAGLLWLLTGFLMVASSVALGVALDLNGPAVLAVGLLAAALWTGVTTVALVRSK